MFKTSRLAVYILYSICRVSAKRLSGRLSTERSNETKLGNYNYYNDSGNTNKYAGPPLWFYAIFVSVGTYSVCVSLKLVML